MRVDLNRTMVGQPGYTGVLYLVWALTSKISPCNITFHHLEHVLDLRLRCRVISAKTQAIGNNSQSLPLPSASASNT